MFKDNLFKNYFLPTTGRAVVLESRSCALYRRNSKRAVYWYTGITAHVERMRIPLKTIMGFIIRRPFVAKWRLLHTKVSPFLHSSLVTECL